jgi:hypothetical protein
MIKDQTLDRLISERLIANRVARDESHKPSGKLSASMLGQPVQWQILKTIGVPAREIDEYTLRKFLRGDHVEEWLLSYMPGIIERQKFAEYRGAIGYCDALVDCSEWTCKKGMMPHEVKSVSNMKFKRIIQEGTADHGHRLQACLYALAFGTEYYALDYVATDDYRVETYIYHVETTISGVVLAIDEYREAVEAEIVPEFEAKEKWQASAKYNNYPDFMSLSEAEIDAKLEAEYPNAYLRLKSLKETENAKSGRPIPEQIRVA